VHTYTFINSYVTWGAARSACEENGLQLATISMANEEQAALDAIAAGGGNVNDHVWIGLTDASSEGSWSWSDGSVWPYRHWRSGQPDGSSSENCATIQNTNGWHDVDCFWMSVHGYLCSESSVPYPPRASPAPPLLPASLEAGCTIGNSALSPKLLAVALSSIALNIALSILLIVVCRKSKQRAQPLPVLTTTPMLTMVPPLVVSSTGAASTPGGEVDLGIRRGGKMHEDAAGLHDRM